MILHPKRSPVVLFLGLLLLCNRADTTNSCIRQSLLDFQNEILSEAIGKKPGSLSKDLQETLQHLSPPSESSAASVDPTGDIQTHVKLLVTDRDEEEEDEDEKIQRAIILVTRKINSFFSPEKTVTSEAAYTPLTLAEYDLAVWSFNSPFHWRIRKQDVWKLYLEGVAASSNHAEVGVGTCVFLHDLYSSFSSEDIGLASRPRHIGLFDLSIHSLDACKSRLNTINHVREGTAVRISANLMDITRPNPLHAGLYNSVAANFLLHCLHGSSINDKRDALISIRSLLKSSKDSVFFGSTILGEAMLQDEEAAGVAAIETLLEYNKIGIFGNLGDSINDLSILLKELYEEVEIYQVGYCAFWIARNPKPYCHGCSGQEYTQHQEPMTKLL